jgi:chromosome segregation ATPase
MSNRSLGAAETVIPLAPKSNVRSEASDQLDKARQAILGLLNRAATAAETNYQQTIEMTQKLSAQLRAAEDRIRELEAKVRYHHDRADRAERWLYQISGEIEHKFFGREEARSSRPPSPQASSGQNR